MPDQPMAVNGISGRPRSQVLAQLRKSVDEGCPWADALVQAIGFWPAPSESHNGRRFNYFIAGEAFDWLLLAERLCESIEGAVPRQEKEDLLFKGRFPPSFDRSCFKDLLGIEKYRGYLNFYYGVTVEEALQLATELDVVKRHASNGAVYKHDQIDEAFLKIYGSPMGELLQAFRIETGSPSRRTLSLHESKEFTYWLFKYRLKNSDKARTASDTRKGLMQLQRMGDVSGAFLGAVDHGVLDVNAVNHVVR